MVAIADLLDKLSDSRYTWQQLQDRPLPEGVDPLRLEAYLQDDEFQVRWVSRDNSSFCSEKKDRDSSREHQVKAVRSKH